MDWNSARAKLIVAGLILIVLGLVLYVAKGITMVLAFPVIGVTLLIAGVIWELSIRSLQKKPQNVTIVHALSRFLTARYFPQGRNTSGSSKVGCEEGGGGTVDWSIYYQTNKGRLLGIGGILIVVGLFLYFGRGVDARVLILPVVGIVLFIAAVILQAA